MNKRKLPLYNINTSFCNPFAEGDFYYGGTKFIIPTEEIQTYLYLYIYGVSSRALWPLFLTHIHQDMVYRELPYIYMPKVLSRLARTCGCEHTTYFATVLDEMVNEAIKENLMIDRDNFTPKEFNNWGREILAPWIKIYILKKFPNIINDLKKTFPKIKVFL